MAALSDYAEKLLLDWMMTNGSVTRPTAWYVALFTTATDDASGGTEVSGNGYSRQTVTFDAATSGTGTTSNTDAPTFTAAGGNWGTITHIAIHDAATGGNRLWHGAMAASKTIEDGDSLQFAIGNIDLTIA
jgi:hypothetical protein